MGLIFDTSVLVAVERVSSDIEKYIKGRESEPFGISVITASELLHGVHRADSESRRLKRETFVEMLLDSFTIYPFDLRSARIYARIWASLAKKGATVGAHDLIIASTAISLGFSVLTCNLRDYEKIKGLEIEQFR
jgi:tRNA(fMet)-specific endonuclease VapC